MKNIIEDRNEVKYRHLNKLQFEESTGEFDYDIDPDVTDVLSKTEILSGSYISASEKFFAFDSFIATSQDIDVVKRISRIHDLVLELEGAGFQASSYSAMPRNDLSVVSGSKVIFVEIKSSALHEQWRTQLKRNLDYNVFAFSGRLIDLESDDCSAELTDWSDTNDPNLNAVFLPDSTHYEDMGPERYVLSIEDAEVLFAALENPTPMTAAELEDEELYRRMVRSRD